jgi:predicted  nucleic acid-binding Zn-ribbon protein
MDFDNNGNLSKKEFASAWFKGQVMDGPVLSDKFRRAGGDPATDMITKLSFVYTIVKRHAGVSSSKQMLMKKTLKTFVKQTHEIRMKRMKEMEEAQKYVFLQEKANRCDDQAKEIVLLKAQLANAAHLETDLVREKESVKDLQARVASAETEKTSLKVANTKLQRKIDSIPPPAPPTTIVQGGATAEERAQFEARTNELEAKIDQLLAENIQANDALEHAQADLGAALKAKEGAEKSAQSLKELVAETQAELEKIRAQKMITQDWGPLCVSQKANTQAALTSLPLEVKNLQNRLDDLSAAMRVLVRVRPLLLSNPDWKKLGMETKKSKQYCRAARKWQKKNKAAGLAYPYLTKAQEENFNKVRKTDEDCADCVVTDVEAQAVSVVSKGVVVPHGRFHPMSDVMPYGGPFQHTKARPNTSNPCVWERIEPLITSAMRRTPNNVVVFAYGGTGSGKTFTMGGYDSKDSERENLKTAKTGGQVFFNGVRCMLDEVETNSAVATSRKPSVEFTLSMMMADNYKNDMSDLLCEGGERDRLKTADVVRLGSSGDPWDSFTKHEFTDFNGFWEGYRKGISLRKVESAMNDDSSRSHLCICFEIVRREVDTYGTVARESISKVILVDLAGSENMREVQRRIEMTWIGDKPSMMKYLKEARLQTQAINKALHTLQTCIQEISKAIKRAGATGEPLTIPRKAFPSLLTKLLAVALKPCVLSPIGGTESTETPKASRIMMVCCIAAAGTWRATTMESLAFASECMKIKLEDPAQLKLKKPLIDSLETKKTDLLELHQECEAFLEEHSQEELLQLDDEEQKLWHDKALAYSKKIARVHKEVARLMASSVPTAPRAAATGAHHGKKKNLVSALTHGHFGEGKHRRATAALLTKGT